jgi:hypothetical protein
MYQFILDKSSKKFICPNCNKRTFVRFVDNETGNYLTENYGRCDRETECKFYAYPKSNKRALNTFFIPEIKQTSFIKIELLEQTENNYSQNNFVNYLLNNFDLKDVAKALEIYHIGTSKHWEGANIFWQIDHRNKVRTGKIMLYDKSNGKRIKEPFNHVNWVHSVLKIKDYNLKQCLFGLHRLNVDLSKPIAIVESEKTAVIMSIVCPDFLWMATGSKSNLKEEFLKPLRNRKIILHPDYGEFEDWQKVVIQLKSKGYKIAISKLLEQMNLKKGFDLADFI